MRIKTIYLFIFLTFFLTNIFPQKKNAESVVCYIEKLKEDSVYTYISNNSLVDTLHFAIYKQVLINEKILMTNVYDIFCDNENPKTTNFILYPNNNLSFKVRVSSLMFPEEEIEEKGWVVQCAKYRFMLKVKVNNAKEESFRFYSNYIDE